VVDSRKQVRHPDPVIGAAQALAIHRDHGASGDVADRGGRPHGQALIEIIGVDTGQGTSEGRFRRQPCRGIDSQLGQHVPVGVVGPFGDRDPGPGTSEHRSGGTRQYHRQGMSQPARLARVGHRGEDLYQRDARSDGSGRR